MVNPLHETISSIKTFDTRIDAQIYQNKYLQETNKKVFKIWYKIYAEKINN